MKIYLMIALLFISISCKQKMSIDNVDFDLIKNSPGLNEGLFRADDVNIDIKPQVTGNMTRLALEWLAKNQEEDGHWDTGKFGGRGDKEANLASTAMVLYAFSNAGYGSKNSKFYNNINRTTSWIMTQQRPDGSFGEYVHTNAICVMALSEVSRIRIGKLSLRASVQSSLLYLFEQQNASGGFSYRGKGPMNIDDMVSIGFCAFAFSTALQNDMNSSRCKKALRMINNLLNNAKYTNDNTESTKGESWYQANGLQGSGKAGGSCQAIAMCIRQKSGWRISEPWLMAAADAQALSLPKEYKGLDVFKTFFSFDALFQVGGENFRRWYSPVKKIILEAQRQDGKFKGSWDPTGCSLNYGGRVLYTAMLSTIFYSSYGGLH